MAPLSNIGNQFASKAVTVLMTIITGAVLSILGFLWSLNKDFAVLQEKDLEKQNKIDVIQQSVNQVRLDQQELKVNDIRFSAKLENIQLILDQQPKIRRR